MEAARGLSASRVALLANKASSGIDWRGSSKGAIADGFTSRQVGSASVNPERLIALLRSESRPTAAAKSTEVPSVAAPTEPGVYVLTRDVTNPDVDRRVVGDWRYAETWWAGSRFVLALDVSLDPPHLVVTSAAERYADIHTRAVTHASARLLAGAWQATGEDPLLCDAYRGLVGMRRLRDVTLRDLLFNGRITPEMALALAARE